jgi:hypothetical protein
MCVCSKLCHDDVDDYDDADDDEMMIIVGDES